MIQIEISDKKSLGSWHINATNGFRSYYDVLRLDFRRSLVSFLPEKRRGRSTGSFLEQRLVIEPMMYFDLQSLILTQIVPKECTIHHV